MKDGFSRREFAKALLRVSLLVGLGYSVFRAMFKHDSGKGNAQCPYPQRDCSSCAISNKCRNTSGSVWQIDPAKCIQCGRCASQCVVSPSAVKCFHAFNVCGYCDLCFAYFKPGTMEFDTTAEKQLCPTNALIRKYVEHPYYEYTIDKEKCIGCAKCVKGCQTFGNGSLFLQVDQTYCVNCNQCAIAKACPANAFVRRPSDRPYLLKGLQIKNDSKGS
jgi:electron transport complex protein RnfB